MAAQLGNQSFWLLPAHADEAVAEGEIWPDGLTQVRWLHNHRMCFYLKFDLLLEQIGASEKYRVSYKHGNAVDDAPRVQVTSVLGVIVI